MIDGKYDKLKSFFREGDLLDAVDLLAKRYGKLPHEIMNELTVFEFNLDLAIAIESLNREQDRDRERTKKKPSKGGNKKGMKNIRFNIKKTQGTLPEDLIAEMAKQKR